MPKTKKAARGKHRWIGLELSASLSKIKLAQKKIESLFSMPNVKLYDFINKNERMSCIVKIKLENYPFIRKILEKGDEDVISITSSGKIRLVRLRLEEYFSAAD